MSNRCESCGTFVSKDQGDPEAEEFRVEVTSGKGGLLAAAGTLTGTVRLVLTCAECGQEMSETTVDVEQALKDEEVKVLLAHLDEDHDLGVGDVELSAQDRMEGRGRGARHYYGFIGTAPITCACHPEVVLCSVEIDGYEQASNFEDCQ